MSTPDQVLRFDLEGRIEVFVTEIDIRQHKDFPTAMALTDPEKRLYALKTIAVSCAQERIDGTPDETWGVKITANAVFSAVNIDRINWQELATP